MPATKRGIYHNLRESKYTASNGEAVFFFSSSLYLKKFLMGYWDNRISFMSKHPEHLGGDYPNMTTLADISFYQSIEKRGFLVWVNGVEMSWVKILEYALQKMTEPNMPDWSKIQRPKLETRLKTMAQSSMMSAGMKMVKSH